MAAKYSADQVGSLLRPQQLLEAREAVTAGRLSAEELRGIEDRAILDALEMQRQAGIDIYTDGELRRRAWFSDLAEAVDGFVPGDRAIEWRGPSGGVERSNARFAAERLRQTRRITAHESGFLKQHAPGPYKITIPAASSFMNTSYRPGLSDRVYSTRLEFGQDIARIIRGELLALIEEGVAYLQLDAPSYCNYVDETLRGRLRDESVDPDKAIEDAIAVDNASLEGVARDGVILAMHVCRGNSRSRWTAQGGYDRLAKPLFGQLKAGRFLLEYDSGRAGDFAPLRAVPSGKAVVLGLVTTKSGKMENQDDLLRRIDEAAKFVPLENLALSPQCGFASTAAGNLLSIDEEQHKLELVAQTARTVWG